MNRHLDAFGGGAGLESHIELNPLIFSSLRSADSSLSATQIRRSEQEVTRLPGTRQLKTEAQSPPRGCAFKCGPTSSLRKNHLPPVAFRDDTGHDQETSKVGFFLPPRPPPPSPRSSALLPPEEVYTLRPPRLPAATMPWPQSPKHAALLFSYYSPSTHPHT